MPAGPAARIDDPVTHDLLVTCGKIDFPLTGPCPHGMVMIEGKIAAHVNCSVYCTGAMNSGAIPHPLHEPPPPPLPPTGSVGTDSACGEDCDSEDEGEVEFTIQIMGGSSHGVGAPKGIPEGVRYDNITFKITDNEGNVAIYDFSGAGNTKDVSLLPVTAYQPIAASDPVTFNVPKGTKVDEFGGQARMTITEFLGGNNVTFRFGKPKGSALDRFGWNEDAFHDWINSPGLMVPPSPTQIKQHAVRVEDLELIEANHDPFKIFGSESDDEFIDNAIKNFTNIFDTALANPSLIGAGDSKGSMELSEYIPLPVAPPPPIKPVPCLNPIVKGSKTVHIHGMPAARWATSGDMTTCGTMLGDVAGLMDRTVWIGG